MGTSRARSYAVKSRTVVANPVARAIVVQKWTAKGVDAQIAAILGSSARTLCNLAGRCFYVVLGAAAAEGMHHDDPDVRVIRGAVNEMYDTADLVDVPERSRAPIVSGLEAVQRLTTRLKVKSLADAHFDMERRLAAGDVNYSDFLALERP